MRDALLSERTRLFDQLQQVSWLEPYPSQANFILCKVLEVRPQLACMQQCQIWACVMIAVTLVVLALGKPLYDLACS